MSIEPVTSGVPSSVQAVHEIWNDSAAPPRMRWLAVVLVALVLVLIGGAVLLFGLMPSASAAGTCGGG